jgi:hypothetical protein
MWKVSINDMYSAEIHPAVAEIGDDISCQYISQRLEVAIGAQVHIQVSESNPQDHKELFT